MKKISFEFDPFELTNTKKLRKKIKDEDLVSLYEEISDYILDGALSKIGSGNSPIKYGQWKRSLSPEYKKEKKKWSSSLYANMELHGDMLDALEIKRKGKTKLEYGVFDPDEAPKADGHNNHSGLSKLPKREFIPKQGGSFKRDILNGVKNIIEDYADGE